MHSINLAECVPSVCVFRNIMHEQHSSALLVELDGSENSFEALVSFVGKNKEVASMAICLNGALAVVLLHYSAAFMYCCCINQYSYGDAPYRFSNRDTGVAFTF